MSGRPRPAPAGGRVDGDDVDLAQVGFDVAVRLRPAEADEPAVLLVEEEAGRVEPRLGHPRLEVLERPAALLGVPVEGAVVDLEPGVLVLPDDERPHVERPTARRPAAAGGAGAARAPASARAPRRRRSPPGRRPRTQSRASPPPCSATAVERGARGRRWRASTSVGPVEVDRPPGGHPLEVRPARRTGDLEVAHRSHGIGVYPRRPMPDAPAAPPERRPRTAAGRARRTLERLVGRVPGHGARPLRPRPPQPVRAAGGHDPVGPVHRRAGEHGDAAPVRPVPDARRTWPSAEPARGRGDHPLDGLLQEQDEEPHRHGHRRRRALRRRGAQPHGGPRHPPGRRAQDRQRAPQRGHGPARPAGRHPRRPAVAPPRRSPRRPTP